MPSKLTLKAVLSQYITALPSRYSAQTVAAYSQAIRLFQTVISKHLRTPSSLLTMGNVTIDWAYIFLAHLQQQHSVETEHLYSRAVLGFYQYLAQQYDLLPDGVFATLTHYITTKRRPKENLSPQPNLDAIAMILTYVLHVAPVPPPEQENFRELLRQLRDKAFLLTLANTGLRVSEICALRRLDTNPTFTTLQIARDTTLPLAPTTAIALQQYLTHRTPLDQEQRLFDASHLPLFARHDKKAGERILPISRWTAANIVHFWTRAALTPQMLQKLTETHSPITPQTFRHYFVVTTLQATGDIQATQTLARHSNATTTRRYSHFLPTDKIAESQ